MVVRGPDATRTASRPRCWSAVLGASLAERGQDCSKSSFRIAMRSEPRVNRLAAEDQTPQGHCPRFAAGRSMGWTSIGVIKVALTGRGST